MMMSYWFSFLFPWLLVLWLIKFLAGRGCGEGSLNWRRLFGVGVASWCCVRCKGFR